MSVKPRTDKKTFENVYAQRNTSGSITLSPLDSINVYAQRNTSGSITLSPLDGINNLLFNYLKNGKRYYNINPGIKYVFRSRLRRLFETLFVLRNI
jgi:hypothetical protein